jgi:hypothetical protein
VAYPGEGIHGADKGLLALSNPELASQKDLGRNTCVLQILIVIVDNIAF